MGVMRGGKAMNPLNSGRGHGMRTRSFIGLAAIVQCEELALVVVG